MDYHDLTQYVSKQMKMQHIYQPVMIKTLLESKEHRASVENIARQFLINDEPQLQYYKYITKVMPGRVLREHGIVTSDGGSSDYNYATKYLSPAPATSSRRSDISGARNLRLCMR